MKPDDQPTPTATVPTASAEETSATADQTSAMANEYFATTDLIEEEQLIEEISIDGMCGVY